METFKDCYYRYDQVDSFSFQLSGDASSISTAIATLDASNVNYGDGACAADYIVVAGASLTGSDADLGSSKDRFCGQALGYCKKQTSGACTATVGAITSFSKPFLVRIVTDSDEGGTNEKSNRGFNLVFSQQPCLTSG